MSMNDPNLNDPGRVPGNRPYTDADRNSTMTWAVLGVVGVLFVVGMIYAMSGSSDRTASTLPPPATTGAATTGSGSAGSPPASPPSPRAPASPSAPATSR